MDNSQADQMIELLTNIRDEVVGLRSDFMEFTGYNVDRMSKVVDDLGDRIAGGSEGIGGGTLDEVRAAIEALETVIDLK